MIKPIILISNPGSLSRKYALFKGDELITTIHFEVIKNTVMYSLGSGDSKLAKISHITFASSVLTKILIENDFLTSVNDINAVAIRVVAPSEYFQQNRIMNNIAIGKLKSQEVTDPIHVNATLQELYLLEHYFPDKKIIGISDSAYHATMPVYATTYGIPKDIAKKLNIKRYGYHGISVQSVVNQLEVNGVLNDKIVVCHLGGGSSVTAVLNGNSIDTTMGYSPLEGIVMSTRSGNIDPSALNILQDYLKLSAHNFQDFLYYQCGLKGISGKTGDIRELIDFEKKDHDASKLALQVYASSVQKSIGQMATTLNGIESLIFTGTIGERSYTMRERICQKLQYLGIELNNTRNKKINLTNKIIKTNTSGSPVSIFVVPSNEVNEMNKQCQGFL